MKIVGIIPARYGSTRFPGKVLADIGGKPMIQWVYERAKRAAMLNAVVIATDDQRVAQAVKQFGGTAYMTRREHSSGSDRIAEVVRQALPDANLVVNVQGDEPLIEPEAIDLAVNVLLSDPKARVGTLARRISDARDLDNPNVVKVVLARDHTALYFSRSAIPYFRDNERREEWLKHHLYLKHVGIYVYRRELLLEYVSWPPGRLEISERLEQLRLLEHGVPIHVALTEYDGRSVDTPADREATLAALANSSTQS